VNVINEGAVALRGFVLVLGGGGPRERRNAVPHISQYFL